ncbi:hypothetical protein Prudu_346S000400 [Prunus dulcis]|uniref:Ubiquitin-like protease family profile domain-containing protein n=1 Tax=Prunus dulcis TaxID=3755 RepID=A0A5H2XMG6_PRUDU|nr:hypothetical protein Prudu_346S000400 [Prunus dulcis]
MEAPSSLKTLCRYVETTLMPEEKILQLQLIRRCLVVNAIPSSCLKILHNLQAWKKLELLVAVYMSMVGFIDPATVSANSGTIADRSRLVAVDFRRQTPSLGLADCKAKRETVYFLDPLPGHRVVDEEAKKHREQHTKATSSVECGYYVMRFMRDIIMDPSLAFENKYAKGNQEASYPQEAIDEVRNEWAEFVCQIIEQGIIEH